MARVLLTTAQVGVAIGVQERLERAGHSVTWDTDREPDSDGGAVDVVLVNGGADLGERVGAWRASQWVPAVLVLGRESDGPAASACGVFLLTSLDGLESAVRRSLHHRFGTSVSPNVGRAALGIDATGDELRRAIVVRGRDVADSIVRDALESRAQQYVTSTELAAALRASKTLDIPEVEITAAANGAVTLTRVVASSSLPVLEAGRRIWALACAGALRFDSDPIDASTGARRRTLTMRNHIRARLAMALPTAYDVLEVTRGAYLEDVEEAVRALGYRFSPDATADIDLGDLEGSANRLWMRVLEARAALYYETGQKQLDAFIDVQLAGPGAAALANSWGHPSIDPTAASSAFARGQAALSAGEVFSAVSEMAAAARAHPNHPIYESYLAWTQYRCAVARGADRRETAARERKTAEAKTVGRRPFPQALVALSLLCVATGDAVEARSLLRDALALDPDLPAARLILGRLG